MVDVLPAEIPSIERHGDALFGGMRQRNRNNSNAVRCFRIEFKFHAVESPQELCLANPSFTHHHEPRFPDLRSQFELLAQEGKNGLCTLRHDLARWVGQIKANEFQFFECL